MYRRGISAAGDGARLTSWRLTEQVAALSPALENSAATFNFIGCRGVQIAFPPQRQTDFWADGEPEVGSSNIAYACGSPLNEYALTAGQNADWRVKTLIYLVLRGDSLPLGRSN